MTSPVPTTDPAFPAQFLPLAEEICARYYEEFPDTDEQHGARGRAYCAHDNAYLVAWLLQAVELTSPPLLQRNAMWLAELLIARGFPLPRFVRNLELVAERVVVDGLAAQDAVDGVARPTIAALAELSP